MLLQQINWKHLTTQSLILLFLMTMLTPANAGYSFSYEPSSDTPTEQTENTKDKKHQKKKGKRFKNAKEKVTKFIKKLKEKLPKQDWSTLGEDDKYGTIAVWTFAGSLVLSLFNIPALALIASVLGIISLVTAIIGYAKDENPKKAKIILIINLIAILLLAILFIAFLAAII